VSAACAVIPSEITITTTQQHIQGVLLAAGICMDHAICKLHAARVYSGVGSSHRHARRRMYICTRDEATRLTDAISLSLSLSLWVFSCATMMQALLPDGRHAERERERESHMHRDRSKRLVALGPLFTRPCIKIAVSVWLHSDDRCSLILGWDVQWVYHHVMLSSQERSTWCWWTGLVYIQEKWANKKGKRC
jgi:hypothetical protein